MANRWGLDLGGTKIEGVILGDGDKLDIKCRLRVPTEQSGGYEHIVSQVAKLISMMSAETGLKPQKIGIGTPGTTDPTSGLLKNSNTTSLNGKPLKQMLEAAIGVPFVMSNDANCFAMAETHLGVVKSLGYLPETVVGLILGTGVGSGIVINGQVINGMHGIGGEWGHNTLVKDGEKCYCGKHGCTETVIAGPALERFYKVNSGKQLRLADIVSLVDTDVHARATIDRLVTHLGYGLSFLINTLDPDVFVIGGGVGNIDAIYDRVAAAALPYSFNPELKTKFLKPELGDSAGVFGAAMLV